MNIQNSKENIQPLATGRNAERLETALDAETNLESREEIERQRKALENAIKNYEGDDPLESWLEYIHFIEQTFPKSGKEAKLDEILKKCLVKFEKKAQYDQDPRFVRIFTKFIDSKKDPTRYYEKMYNSGKGSRVSEFYIAWAFYYDFIDNFEKAGKIYQKGLDARAEPVEQLKEAYTRFQF
ncbi:Mitotic checkpoint serine/threonine-protein kinase BUB1 beta, partial [Pseudolycoriella hygida]